VIGDILPRLDKVRRTGKGNWLTCCPAHDDRNPSMTIHEADDGRILVRCFAGCGFGEIVGAVGLGWEPWFPPKQPEDFKPAVKRPFPATDVLEALALETTLVAVAACNVARGIEMNDEDKARLLLAAERIEEGRRLALG
jgi:hypothetical protein